MWLNVVHKHVEPILFWRCGYQRARRSVRVCLQGLPSSLLLENSEKDRFLLLPSATLPGRPESKVLFSFKTMQPSHRHFFVPMRIFLVTIQRSS